jgi:hypothetical protein
MIALIDDLSRWDNERLKYKVAIHILAVSFLPVASPLAVPKLPAAGSFMTASAKENGSQRVFHYVIHDYVGVRL